MKRRNFGHLIEAVVYIFLLMFFTYTFIAVECLKDVNGVYDAYLQNQKTVFALLTNFGLYFMLLIDYQAGKSKLPSWVMWSMAACIIIDILIYGDAMVLADPLEYSSFRTLLSFPNAFICMHLATIAYLVFIKYKSLEEVSVSVKF